MITAIYCYKPQQNIAFKIHPMPDTAAIQYVLLRNNVSFNDDFLILSSSRNYSGVRHSDKVQNHDVQRLQLDQVQLS